MDYPKEKTMKRRILTAICIILIGSFMACAQHNNGQGAGTAQNRLEPSLREEQVMQVGETFYPISENQNFFWLENGEMLAVPNGDTIQYLDLSNQPIKKVTIPQEQLIGDYTLWLTDNRILVAGGYNGEHNPGNFSLCNTGDEWVLANGSIWDGDGNLLREFLQVTCENPGESEQRLLLSDGREIASWGDMSILEVIAWIDSDLIAFNGHNRLCLYRISTDELMLVDDMSGWMKEYGKMQAYLGIHEVMPAANESGCYYFAYKNQQLWNQAGTIWYADETGSRVLFDGQHFNRTVYENGMLLMIDWVQNPETNRTQTTRLWYATDGDLQIRKLAQWDGFYNVERTANGFIMIEKDDEPYQFYLLDTLDASLTSYHPQAKNCNQYQMLGARKNGDSVQSIYSAFINGELSYYLYDEQTGVSRTLACKPFLFGNEAYNQPMTHFAERFPNESYEDMYHTTGVRVSEIR